MKPEQSNNSNSFLIKIAVGVSILPGIALPFYNAILHGPRYAASIVSRGAAYSEAHMIGASLSLLLIFGVLAIYLYQMKNTRRLGAIAFMLALAGQALWAGLLLVDGILNPLLAHFDPMTQTHLHSVEFSQTASGHNYLTTLFGPSLFYFDVISLVYLVGFALFGFSIIRAKILPKAIGYMFIVGSVPVAFSLMLPQWLETVGYAAIGWGLAWAGIVIWRKLSRTVNIV